MKKQSGLVPGLLLICSALFGFYPGGQISKTSMVTASDQTLPSLDTANLRRAIDSLLQARSQQPFSGVIRIQQGDQILYEYTAGYADLDRKIPVHAGHQFVIGSISKQFTAVLVLREMEKGRLRLQDPVGKYLPELPRSWKDSVTIYQLLTHTHGIRSRESALLFVPGTKTDYENGNNIGYWLLSDVVEKTSGQRFSRLCSRLFRACGMKNSFHPENKKYRHLAGGYTEQADGAILFDSLRFQAAPGAGCLIATADDLIRWNSCLFGGKVLRPETLKMLCTIQPNVLRQHPVWGPTRYGLGITIRDEGGLRQWGQTGYAPGYGSMNFYFPDTKTSVVVFQNVMYHLQDQPKNWFYYHLQIVELLRKHLR